MFHRTKPNISATTLLNLFAAAHLGGYKTVSLPPVINTEKSELTVVNNSWSVPSSLPESEQTKLKHFKKYIVSLYNRAGVKGEKIVFVVQDDK